MDISKVTNVGYCRCPDGKDIKPFILSNSGHGFNYFWDRIFWMKKSHNMEEIVVGFEYTGSYGIPPIHYLKKSKIKLV